MILGKTACRVATWMVLALVVAGCSPVVAGHAHRDPAFSEWAAIPALLNPGNYPTTPLPPFGTAEQDGRNGAVLEGQRMAAYVVGPWEVDPALVDSVVTETLVLKDATAISALLTDPVQFLAAQHHFVVGFSSNRTASTPTGWAKALTNSVWEFATPEDALGAALEISQQAPVLPASHPAARLQAVMWGADEWWYRPRPATLAWHPTKLGWERSPREVGEWLAQLSGV